MIDSSSVISDCIDENYVCNDISIIKTSLSMGSCLADENVCLDIIKNYFQEEIWVELTRRVEEKKMSNLFVCMSCKEIDDKIRKMIA